MPSINKYKCNKCGFSLPEGWGGYAYMEDVKGKRMPIPHPDEMRVFFEPMKMSIFGNIKPGKRRKGIEEITGFNSDCLCLDCLRRLELDIGNAEDAKESWRYSYGAVKKKDERRCIYCNSGDVKTVLELIGKPCPQCKEGTIEEIKTGVSC